MKLTTALATSSEAYLVPRISHSAALTACNFARSVSFKTTEFKCKYLNYSGLAAPNWHMSAFEKRLRETERS